MGIAIGIGLIILRYLLTADGIFNHYPEPEVTVFKTSEEIAFEGVINDTEHENKITKESIDYLVISESSYYQNEVAKWDDRKKVRFLVCCIEKIDAYFKVKERHVTHFEARLYQTTVLYFNHLFKTEFQLDNADAIKLIDAFLNHRSRKYHFIIFEEWPIATLLKKIENQYADKPLSGGLQDVLNKLKNKINEIDNSYYIKTQYKLTDKIDTIFLKSTNTKLEIRPTKFIGKDGFSDYANPQLEMFPIEERVIWYQIIASAQRVSGTKPSQRFLKESKNLIDTLGDNQFKLRIVDWFSNAIKFKDLTLRETYINRDSRSPDISIDMICSRNTDAVKALIWMCLNIQDTKMTALIAKVAERCYKKSSYKGAVAPTIANACIYTLANTQGLNGISELSRLKLRIKQNNAQKIIENYLTEAAVEHGYSVSEMEDFAVPDFELIKGKKEIIFKDYIAELKITGAGKSEMNWYKHDGKIQKTVPSFIKEGFADEYTALKETKKQLDQTTTTQSDRMDRLFRDDRKWSFNNFVGCYFSHGLMSVLTKKIIWNFSETTQGNNQSAIFLKGQWTTSENEILLPAPNCIVTLWHPAVQSVTEVQKWREFISTHEILQPFKQAYREVYLLTDAEINTRTYSNRMASHILKQQQFNTLAKSRGWKYSLMGYYDYGNHNELAKINLPAFNMRAEYWIDQIKSENNNTYSISWDYIGTDQVRFVNNANGQTINLIDVPAIPFSEILRDVDLFVGAASVGNDPNWNDSQGEPRVRDYWQSYSFGNLSAIARNRKDILTKLLPRLKIAKVAEIRDNYVVVRGSRRTYKIHIGSTNILMEPNDQYLCIVQDRSAKNFTNNLFVPFEGDESVSMILSKAFLLADDINITDSTINTQIDWRG